MCRTTVLLLVALSFSAATACAQDDDAWLARTYNITTLTQPVQHRPGPPIGLNDVSREEMMFDMFEEESYLFTMDPDYLTDVIQETVHPDSWHDDRSSIAITGEGQLSIMQRVKVHKAIAEFLDTLTRNMGRTVRIEGKLLLFAKDPLSLEELRGGSISAESLAALEKRPDVRVQAQGRVSAVAGQRVHVARIQERTYVADYDVEIAQDAAIATPLMDQLSQGFVLDVQAQPVSVAGKGAVHVVARVSAVQSDTTIPTFDLNAPEMGKVHLPQVRNTSIRTAVTLPSGTWTAILIGYREGTDMPGAAVFLRADAATPPTATLELSDTPTRSTRMYELAGIGPETPDFPAPAVGLPRFSDEGAYGAAFSLEEEPLALVPEEILDLITQNVAPQTWETEGSSISYQGGFMFVMQAKAVHQMIEEYLSALTGSRRRTLAVEVRLFRAKVEDLPDLPAVGSPFSPEQLAELVASGQAIAGGRLLGYHSQRFHFVHGSQQRYVQGCYAQVAQSSRMADPVIGTVSDGLVLEVAPSLTRDGRNCFLELNGNLAQIESMEVFTGAAGPIAHVQLPSLSQESVGGTLTVPLGKVCLLSAAARDAGEILISTVKVEIAQ